MQTIVIIDYGSGNLRSAERAVAEAARAHDASVSVTSDPDLVRKVIDVGYAADLTDDEIEQVGRDPFLMAYALASDDRCVVTVEISAPKKQRQNRKVPDVCKALGVRCCSPFEFNRLLDFRTQWKVDSGRP